MKPLVFLGILAGALSPVLSEDAGFVGVEIDPGSAINQHLYPDSANACGPAAIANSLRFGRPQFRTVWDSLTGGEDKKRFRLLIDRYFLGRQSVVFPELKRLQQKGVEGEDLASAFSEILKDHKLGPVTGRHLDREKDESDVALVARVHRKIRDSLRAGLPPVIGFRSFIARRDEKSDTETAGEVAWKPARHHYVVITSVPDRLAEKELGFRCELIDPNGAEVKSAFLYAEPQQTFMALKGNERTGAWLGGSPFLVVQAPAIRSLRPKEAVWRDRIVVVAHFLITVSDGFD